MYPAGCEETVADGLVGNQVFRLRRPPRLCKIGRRKFAIVADQYSIAEAVGSVREVVAMALRKLRDDGVLVRETKGLNINRASPSCLDKAAPQLP